MIALSIAMIKGIGPLARFVFLVHTKRDPYAFDFKGYLRFAGFMFILLSITAFLLFVGGEYSIIWMRIVGIVLSILLTIYILIRGGVNRFKK